LLKEYLIDHNNIITFNNKYIFSRLRSIEIKENFSFVSPEYDDIIPSNSQNVKKILSTIRSINPIIEQEDGYYLTYK